MSDYENIQIAINHCLGPFHAERPDDVVTGFSMASLHLPVLCRSRTEGRVTMGGDLARKSSSRGRVGVVDRREALRLGVKGSQVL